MKRLDEVLIEKCVAADKNEAFVIVTEGRVLVNGQKAISPAQTVSDDAKIEVRDGDDYVGRGAEKLEGAMAHFGINLQDKICADIGAATGGFTEVMLRYGCRKVYAVDTAKWKLALKLRQDPRVVVMEGVNILYLELLPEPIDFASIDVSLTSLRFVLCALKKFLKSDGEVVALFKPQYETRDPKILKHGVVRDGAARKNLLNEFLEWAKKYWSIRGWIESPIRGSKGNIEYLVYLNMPKSDFTMEVGLR